MADVARMSGVSTQTVSRYFTGAGYVHADTRERISAAVDELGYRPNQTARNLRSQRTNSVGVLSLGGLNYGTARLLTGLSEAAWELGVTLSITQLDLDFEAEGWHGQARRALDHFLSIQVDGVVVTTPVPGVEELLVDLEGRTRVVTVSERPGAAGASVSMHSYAAARMATEHLVALGHERILHVAGPRTRNEAFERERGYRDAMAASELAARVVEGVRDWSAASGDQAAREVDPASFTAVFAANDEIALGFMSAMAACGAVAPRDYSIVGVDDMPSAAYFSPPLSSMRLDFRELGIGAFRLLQRLIRTGDRPEHLVLEPTLVLRESTAPPRG